jgi:hypothetical protein
MRCRKAITKPHQTFNGLPGQTVRAGDSAAREMRGVCAIQNLAGTSCHVICLTHAARVSDGNSVNHDRVEILEWGWLLVA